MNKTLNLQNRRMFIIEDLPEPLTRASTHLQIFDNYLPGTRLRLRSIRVPETKAWTRSLQQIETVDTPMVISEIMLNEAEHASLEHLEGSEIRKNRYFYETGETMFEFDVYLGSLWGLNALSCDIPSDEVKAKLPGLKILQEITKNRFFDGSNLVGKSLDDIRAEIDTSLNGATGPSDGPENI